MTPRVTPSKPPTATEALHEVVARLQQAQQSEDVDMFTGLFRHDAVWTTALGRRLTGLPEIAEFTQKVLPGAMSETTATYDITHIVWVRPDVAIVNVVQVPVDLEGKPLEEVPEGRPTYVIAKSDDGWQLVAGQNTQAA